MPMYVHGCEQCGKEQEDFLSLDAPTPTCCGETMKRLPQAAGMAFVTRNGNWWNRTAAAGPVWKGGGRPRAKEIGRGHGLGGHRPNPSARQLVQEAQSAPEKGK